MSYYYAELNEKDICVSISEVDAEINEYNFIRISSLDQSIIGKWYDRFNERFVVAPVHIAAEHSSNEIQYKDQEVWLNDVIDAKAEATDVYTKAEVDAKFVETSDNDANDILAKIKTVDGAGSDLDADTLDGKQASEFATADHTHDYLPLSGGEVGGELDVNGIVRVKGNQGIYVASGQMTFGTNNLKTYIVGSSISSRVAITIASDKRLKENIETADINALADLISKLRVVNYNYIGDEEKQRVGIIAQDLQAVNPELAKRFIEVDDEGYLRVSFSELVFPLIAAVQELQKRVAELEKAE